MKKSLISSGPENRAYKEHTACNACITNQSAQTGNTESEKVKNKFFITITVKFLNFQTPENIDVIYLNSRKFKENSQSFVYFFKKKQLK